MTSHIFLNSLSCETCEFAFNFGFDLFLDPGAGHSNNCQIIHKSFGHDIFCYNLQHKKISSKLKVSEVLITYVTIGRRPG